MSDSPQGWQYPQLPNPQMPPFPQGPGGPGAVAPSAQPPRPPALQRAVYLMYAGAVLGLTSVIANSVSAHNPIFYTYSSTTTSAGTTTTTNYVADGIIGGIIVAGLWLWMVWKAGTGRGWARVLSTVFFGIECLGLIGSIVNVAKHHTVVAFLITLIYWGVALTALIYLWQRDSSNFFAYSKQARAATKLGYQSPYGYAPPQYGQPGYGYQPPQYGQPGYGQPPQDDRPGYGQPPPWGQEPPSNP